MIRVLIADDHAIVREGLANILAAAEDVEVAATASSGPEMLDLLRRHPIDVALIDLSMPGMNGLEALKQIQAEIKHVPVLILSMHPEDQYALRCLKAGAAGYLTKACGRKELLEAIRRIAGGGQYISSVVSKHLLAAVRRPAHHEAPHQTLSDREFEVFLFIAQGIPLNEMAKRLILCPKTVSTYRTRIVEKMGLPNNAAIMRYAFDHNLNEGPETRK